MINRIKIVLSNKVVRIGTMVSVLGILASLGILIYGHFTVNKIIGVKNEILDLTEPSTGKRYRRLTEDYNATKDERALLAQVRPTKQDVAYFVQALDDLAARAQVTQIVEVVTQRDTQGEIKYAVPSVRYKLNVAGPFSSVVKYMKEVDRLPYLLRIVSVQTKASQEKILADETLGTIIIDIASRE